MSLKYVVVGGLGFVGQRLCEMLAERHPEAEVVCFDCRLPEHWATRAAKITIAVGDIRDGSALTAAVRGAECVFNCAALVGPYHPIHLYDDVNHLGALRLVQACKEAGVSKMVMTSTPSARFDPWHLDIRGLKEEELQFPDEMTPPRPFTAEYARTKALGERAALAARCATFGVVAVAPHQVYGPRDRLAMPNILAAARRSLFRVFGDGDTQISMTFVDNYCHALMLAAERVAPGSHVDGKFYIVTDGPPCNFWRTMDNVITSLYGPSASIFRLWAIPRWLILGVAYCCDAIAWLSGKPLKLNSFAVKMLTIDRYFDISNARRDLEYEPVVSAASGWQQTIDWLRANDGSAN